MDAGMPLVLRLGEGKGMYLLVPPANGPRSPSPKLRQRSASLACPPPPPPVSFLQTHPKLVVHKKPRPREAKEVSRDDIMDELCNRLVQRRKTLGFIDSSLDDDQECPLKKSSLSPSTSTLSTSSSTAPSDHSTASAPVPSRDPRLPPPPPLDVEELRAKKFDVGSIARGRLRERSKSVFSGDNQKNDMMEVGQTGQNGKFVVSYLLVISVLFACFVSDDADTSGYDVRLIGITEERTIPGAQEASECSQEVLRRGNREDRRRKHREEGPQWTPDSRVSKSHPQEAEESQWETAFFAREATQRSLRSTSGTRSRQESDSSETSTAEDDQNGRREVFIDKGDSGSYHGIHNSQSCKDPKFSA
uniref:Protein TSSC4 n=1 Tax=Steinernema glaseri TaxID=37863 RepID=A0A1I7YSI9_9BILA